jgi:hypothetical protein
MGLDDYLAAYNPDAEAGQIHSTAYTESNKTSMQWLNKKLITPESFKDFSAALCDAISKVGNEQFTLIVQTNDLKRCEYK